MRLDPYPDPQHRRRRASMRQRAITSMREAARQFVAVPGPCHGIVDVSAVETVDQP